MVYEICKYVMKNNITLYTAKEMPFLEEREKDFYFKGTNNKVLKSNLWEYSTKKPDNCYSYDDQFLPYFADVTQDWPIKYEPKTYKNCQLMVKKHGSYFQFFDHKTKEILRIAINSNYYTPKI